MHADTHTTTQDIARILDGLSIPSSVLSSFSYEETLRVSARRLVGRFTVRDVTLTNGVYSRLHNDNCPEQFSLDWVRDATAIVSVREARLARNRRQVKGRYIRTVSIRCGFEMCPRTQDFLRRTLLGLNPGLFANGHEMCTDKSAKKTGSGPAKEALLLNVAELDLSCISCGKDQAKCVICQNLTETQKLAASIR